MQWLSVANCDTTVFGFAAFVLRHPEYAVVIPGSSTVWTSCNRSILTTVANVVTYHDHRYIDYLSLPPRIPTTNRRSRTDTHLLFVTVSTGVFNTTVGTTVLPVVRMCVIPLCLDMRRLSTYYLFEKKLHCWSRQTTWSFNFVSAQARKVYKAASPFNKNRRPELQLMRMNMYLKMLWLLIHQSKMKIFHSLLRLPPLSQQLWIWFCNIQSHVDSIYHKKFTNLIKHWKQYTVHLC